MTNKEAAAHFAAMPDDEQASILVISGQTSSAESLNIDAPGTNLDRVEEEFYDDDDAKLVTAYTQW